jgi:hypothetical protein
VPYRSAGDRLPEAIDLAGKLRRDEARQSADRFRLLANFIEIGLGHVVLSILSR